MRNNGIIFLLIVSCLSLHSQDAYLENLHKYWNYRYHLLGDYNLKEQHMPWETNYLHQLGEGGMVVVGGNAGNSTPATNIELYNISDNLITNNFDEYSTTNYQCIDIDGSLPRSLGYTFNPFTSTSTCANVYSTHSSQLEDHTGILNFDDQSPNYLAYYMMLLSTEWKLLKQNGQSTTNTEEELYYAVRALIRMDEFSATKFPNESTQPNGFFYRDEVPWDLALGDNFGVNDIVSSNGACDNYTEDLSKCSDGGDYVEHASGMMSQDNVCYLLCGLAFVTELLDDNGINYDTKQMAREEAGRIVTWFRNGTWRLRNPNGDPVCKGSLGLARSFIYAKAGKRITGHPNANAYQNFFSQTLGRIMWWGYRTIYAANLNPSAQYQQDGILDNDVQTSCVAIAGNTWWECGNCNANIGNRAYLSYYGGDHRGVDYLGIHLDLMNAVLNGYPTYYQPALYETALNMYPCYSTPRNIRTDSYTDVEARPELAYMLLFNLYSLAFPQNTYYNLEDWGSVSYNNLLDRDITASFPKVFPNQGNPVVVGGKAQPAHVQGAQSLTLEAKLSSSAAVNFSAPHVTMLPGFVANYGSVSVVENARMDCTAEEYYTSGGTVFNAAKTDEPVNQEEEDWSEDSVRFYMKELKAFLMNPDVDQEMKEDIREAIKQFALLNSLFSAMYDFDLNVYPNPFDNLSQVSFSIPETTFISIAIYDLSGRLVKTIAENQLAESGIHTLSFSRDGMSSGVYVLTFNDTKGNRTSKQISIL